MVSTRTTLFAVLTLVAGGVIAGAVTGSLGTEEPRIKSAAARNTDASIEILEIRSFVLDEPYTHWWRKEPVDHLYNGVVALCQWAHHKLTALQTGELRWYATSMVFGLVLLLAIMLRNAT